MWAKLSALLAVAMIVSGCSKWRGKQTLGARNAHAMAYDAARHRVILFGGADERAVLGDTWGWDGEHWSRLATDGPPPRTFPVMAYDTAHARVLLFGGNRVLFGTDRGAATLLNDLWAWDGDRWEQVSDGTGGPSPRAEACGGFDEERRRFVIFGGYEKLDGTVRRLDDTWEWDGAAWARIPVEGPRARSGAAMTYRPARTGRAGGMVLFGGATGTPPPQSDTWFWSGSEWRRFPADAPGGRFNAVMAYDGEQKTLLRFGGWTGRTRVDELWKMNDDTWAPVDSRGPAARNHTAWAYDAARRYLVLYGGHDGDHVFADTWTYDGARWSKRAERPPFLRIDNGH